MAKVQRIEEQSETKESAAKEITGKIYTYIGGGDSSPHVINFMGLQTFVRGKATEVTNPAVLAKIAKNPTFTEGEVGMEELHDADQKASKVVEAKRMFDERKEKNFKSFQKKQAQGLSEE